MRIQVMTRGRMADSYDDLYFIEGNIFDMQKQTIDYFKERLPRVAYFYADKSGRYNDFVYPIDVLDEAIRQRGSVFTKADYVAAFDAAPSKGTAQNDLVLMLKLGLTEKLGDGPSTKYKVR